MASSGNSVTGGLGAQLISWGVQRLPPSPAPRSPGMPVRGPLKSIRKSGR
jgi:hypothetical protein